MARTGISYSFTLRSSNFISPNWVHEHEGEGTDEREHHLFDEMYAARVGDFYKYRFTQSTVYMSLSVCATPFVPNLRVRERAAGRIDPVSDCRIRKRLQPGPVRLLHLFLRRAAEPATVLVIASPSPTPFPT